MMHGPFLLELKVYLTNGEKVAVASYEMPVGQNPTSEAIQKGIDAALASTTLGSLGGDWRLMTREEFTREVLTEHYPALARVHLAIPGLKEWDKP